MFKNFIDTLNSVSPKVWGMLQFFALIAVVIVGGVVMLHGHGEVGGSLITGAFALLKFEVGGHE